MFVTFSLGRFEVDILYVLDELDVLDTLYILDTLDVLDCHAGWFLL